MILYCVLSAVFMYGAAAAAAAAAVAAGPPGLAGETRANGDNRQRMGNRHAVQVMGTCCEPIWGWHCAVVGGRRPLRITGVESLGSL